MIIKATATFEKTENYIRLLHGFLASSNKFTHEYDTITFEREDGYCLLITTALNYVAFGKKEIDIEDWLGTENISTGEMELLLVWFHNGYVKEIEDYDWLWNKKETTEQEDREGL